jgi:activator of 2-hydroxyglutaryl-CoA dehydratase
VVKRVIEMDSLAGKAVATGGVVSHNPIVLELMAESIGHEVATPPEPQFSGALGAALYAVDEARQ